MIEHFAKSSMREMLMDVTDFSKNVSRKQGKRLKNVNRHNNKKNPKYKLIFKIISY